LVFRHDDRDTLRHQAGDERDIAGQAVEFGHDNRALVSSRPFQRCLQQWPAFERINALGGLDFDKGPVIS
jgi:hypothetical protein